jgi:hypothetical protein
MKLMKWHIAIGVRLHIIPVINIVHRVILNKGQGMNFLIRKARSCQFYVSGEYRKELKHEIDVITAFAGIELSLMWKTSRG